MYAASPSTLAQMLFASRPALNFAHVVRELDQALQRYPAARRSLTWDCDDLAMFDLDGARIVLGYAEDLPGAHPACLTIGVGAAPEGKGASSLTGRRSALCRKITDRVANRYAIDALLWHETPEPLTADLVDRLVDSLPGAALPPLSATPDPAPAPAEAPRAALPALPGPAAPAANDRPDLPLPRNAELARLRAALYAPDEPDAAAAGPSTQMRLAVHAMNATMVVVFIPVGLAAMTSGILRGEDLRLSARLMALTGTAMALAGGFLEGPGLSLL